MEEHNHQTKVASLKRGSSLDCAHTPSRCTRSTMADEYDGEEIELGADDDDLGSPKSVAWKYAWSMNSSHPGNRSAASGTGDAASDRLYRGARSHRETRERLQREEQSRQDVTSERKQSHINKKSAAMMENRFDDVMNKTAIGRYRKEVKALASVRGGQRQGERVNGVFNYGDMLFQEGKMTSDKKERSRAEELRLSSPEPASRTLFARERSTDASVTLR